MTVCEDCAAGEHDYCDRAVAKLKESPGTCGCRLRQHRPIPEGVCDDCMEGDHEECRRQGGWMHQEDDDRCGCHLTGHRLDNRQPAARPLAR